MTAAASTPTRRLKAQAGPQSAFLRCGADMAIYGGSAGSGKSYGLLLDAAIMMQQNPRYGVVIFRRTCTQVTMQGGLWDTSEEIMPELGGSGTKGNMRWSLPNGSVMTFAHLDHEKHRLDYQGAQIPYIGFDELTHIGENQFWYLVSRNRSTAGGPTLIRATCNPDPDHFTHKLIEWWIDPDTGLPIKERSGVLRWFIRQGDKLAFADTRAELRAIYGDGPEVRPKSLTFIPALVSDNKILLEKNPGYLANLLALCTVDRERLLYGNWNVRAVAGSYFQRQWFRLVHDYPHGYRTVRYWDRAGTEWVMDKHGNKEPCYTVGVKMTRDPRGIYYVLDVQRKALRPSGVEDLIRQTAILDGPDVEIFLEQDPGSAGIMEVEYLIRQLSAYPIKAVPVSRDKETRAKAMSCQAEVRNICVMAADWTEQWLNELENFPTGKFADCVDASDGAFDVLALGPIPLTEDNYVIGTREGVGERTYFKASSYR